MVGGQLSVVGIYWWGAQAHSGRILVGDLNRHTMPARKKIGDRITPPKAFVSRADEVRDRLFQLGIEEEDIADAVRWARKEHD